jgi:exodeoxyribonuclease VII small subunit
MGPLVLLVGDLPLAFEVAQVGEGKSRLLVGALAPQPAAHQCNRHIRPDEQADEDENPEDDRASRFLHHLRKGRGRRAGHTAMLRVSKAVFNGFRSGRGSALSSRAMSKKAQAPPRSFEEALTELESILADIESGSVGLEESLARFERGNFLIQHCRSILTSAEKRIELLTRADGSTVKTEPIDDGAL